jgi:hypothetical protein
MSEFFYSTMEVVLSEDYERSENLGVKQTFRKAKVKISLLDISYFHESYTENTEGVMVYFKSGEGLYIVDSFERIDRLHTDFLKEYDKTLLISGKQ